MLRIGLAATLILLAAGAYAQDVAMTALPERTPDFDQVIYKGVGGNLLETLPIEADERVTLQRANAVISSPMTGRTLAVLLGVSGPGFIVAGLVWGLWAALHIEAPKPDTSWLGTAERGGLGFCNGSASKSCQLPVRHEAAAIAEPTS